MKTRATRERKRETGDTNFIKERDRMILVVLEIERERERDNGKSQRKRDRERGAMRPDNGHWLTFNFTIGSEKDR